ncbi:MAG: biotin/lipoyl-containing protein, partial [Actinomycetes bacterium]
MAHREQFALPDVGEGLTEAEIVSWKVKPGDAVKINDVIVEIETAKSLVELPCPYEGVVAELNAAEGETVEVGRPIITVDVGGTVPSAGAPRVSEVPSAGAPPLTAVEPAPAEGAVEPGLIGGPAPGGRTSVLVGYGPRESAAERRPRRAASTLPTAAPA